MLFKIKLKQTLKQNQNYLTIVLKKHNPRMHFSYDIDECFAVDMIIQMPQLLCKMDLLGGFFKGQGVFLRGVLGGKSMTPIKVQSSIETPSLRH